MKDNYLKWLVGLGCIALIVMGVKSVIPTSIAPYLGASSAVDTYSTATSTSVTVGTAGVQMVAGDSNRRFLMIQNNSLIPVYCLLDGVISLASSRVSASSGIGFIIGASSATSTSRWENRGYTGIINCAATTNASTTIIISP